MLDEKLLQSIWLRHQISSWSSCSRPFERYWTFCYIKCVLILMIPKWRDDFIRSILIQDVIIKTRFKAKGVRSRWPVKLIVKWLKVTTVKGPAIKLTTILIMHVVGTALKIIIVLMRMSAMDVVIKERSGSAE